MALVMQQGASITGFNVHLSLNMCVFVEQLGVQKRKHAITLRLHGKFNRGMALV